MTAYELIDKVCRGNLVPSVRGLIEECQEVSEDGVTRLTVKIILNLLLSVGESIHLIVLVRLYGPQDL